MKNKLTVLVTTYLEEQKLNILKELIISGKNYEILVINDKYDDNIIDWGINNEKNYGKFWGIVNNIDNIQTEYYLSIDPDDLMNSKIDWEELEKLGKEVNNYKDSFDFGVNSYYVLQRKLNYKKRLRKGSKIFFYYNPCLIYNVSNIKKTLSLINSQYEGNKLSYYEDILFLLLSYSKGEKAIFERPFYYYLNDFGMTSTPDKYKNEIIQAKSIMDEILNVNECNDGKIIKYRINRVVNAYIKATL